MQITFDHLFELDEIMDKKGWNGRKNNNGDEIKEIVFRLLDYAATEQQYILLRHLIFNYFLCSDYDDSCFQISKNIEGVFFKEKVVIIPVSDDKNKIKSGHAIGYELTRFLDNSLFDEILILESLESIKGRIDEFHIVVIDDFIGSGTQFRSFVRRCIDKYGISPNNIYLYSIVIMKKAHDRIKEFCYGARPIFEFKRSLSDHSELHDIMNPVDVYNQIEIHTGISKAYKSGFLKSEALVTMKKTPNNTLPIFWCRGDPAREAWPSIFPRS